ncbi:RES domain-containing protein [Chloroflexota bacterium]
MVKYICIECIRDEFIKQRINDEGNIQTCTYCKNELQAVSLQTVAEWVDPIYREHYLPGEEYPVSYDIGYKLRYETTGDTPEEIISEILEVDTIIAGHIVEILSENESWEVIKEAQDPLYDSTSNYEFISVSSHRHLGLWYDFCHAVKHESRFYNEKTTQILYDLFSQIDSFKYFGDLSPIREIGPGKDIHFIYRARHVKNDEEVIEITIKPYKELGPPPKSKATAGRMNAQGIPVFYGATDSETCIAEIRLPVSGKAVIAKFEVIQPILVMDLTVFSKMYEVLSLFDSEYEYKASRLEFLNDFNRRISEPVLSREFSSDYIPTQALAEYLANHYEKKIDAIIYSSNQVTQVEGEINNNIVILPHAATVEWPSEISEKDSIDPYGIIWSEDGYYVYKNKPSDESKMHTFDWDTTFYDYTISSTPILRIVSESIEVIQAKSVDYQTESYKAYYREL